MIVALVGADGTGKSTQAKLLVEWLNDSGVPARYFENGGGRPLLDPLARRLGRPDGRTLLGRAYVPVEASFRRLGIARAVRGSRHRVAVMDRYTFCQYAIMRARGDTGEERVRRAYRRFPAPDLTLLLTVPAQVAQRRVELRGRDREDLSYLAAFDAAYRSLPEADTFTVVDASGPVGDVQTTLRSAVTAALGP